MNRRLLLLVGLLSFCAAKSGFPDRDGNGLPDFPDLDSDGMPDADQHSLCFQFGDQLTVWYPLNKLDG